LARHHTLTLIGHAIRDQCKVSIICHSAKVFDSAVSFAQHLPVADNDLVSSFIVKQWIEHANACHHAGQPIGYYGNVLDRMPAPFGVPVETQFDNRLRDRRRETLALVVRSAPGRNRDAALEHAGLHRREQLCQGCVHPVLTSLSNVFVNGDSVTQSTKPD
jgi:hypothetical protein